MIFEEPVVQESIKSWMTVTNDYTGELMAFINAMALEWRRQFISNIEYLSDLACTFLHNIQLKGYGE